MTRLPFDRREDLTTEFKSAAALSDPSGIVRAVAAMLNAEGGEVWIGVQEEAEHAVAIEGIENPSLARRRLEDALVDSLEPAWSPEAGHVEEVRHGNRTLLRIVCRRDPPGRPYARLSGRGGREFPTRVGARIRPMSRDELGRSFGGPTSAADDFTHARERLLEFRTGLLERYADRFWISLAAAPPVHVALDRPAEKEFFLRILTDPDQSHNRRHGFLVLNRFEPISIVGGEGVTVGRGDHWSLRVETDGTILFHVPLHVPAFNTPFRDDRTLWPYALSELPTSFTRLAAAIYEHVQAEARTTIFLDMGISGALHWSLGPYSPDSVGHRVHTRELETSEVLWSDFLSTEWATFRENPDRVAMRAVTRIYEAFGHDDRCLPREWDREEGRLILPA